ncbi:MAG: MFS transporter [Candidatus Midichloriaceae bacterium]
MSKKKIISSAIIGNIVEYYDFGIYAVFAEIIGKLFFPNFSEYVQLMFSFAIFAIGFFMRPLGGIVFGHIGDIFGRKIALTISIVGMGMSTLCIGIMPGYAQIGVLAPILLTIIRMFQGLCIGGEGAGSAIFIIEHFEEKKVGLIGSIIMASNIAGTLLALIVGISIDYFITIDDFTWRYGFLLGGIMGFVGLYMRKKTTETPVFQEMKLKGKMTKLPIIVVLKEKWQNILIIASFASVATSSTYMLRGFFNVYFTEIINLPKNDSLYIVAFALTTVIIALPFFGYLADRMGYKKYIYCVIFVFIVLILPIFKNIIDNFNDIKSIYFSIFFLGILVASIVAPYYPFAIKFFNPELRYSGIALSWNMGNALFGGTTPIISTFLVMKIGYVAPAYYLMFTAGLFLVTSFLNRKFLAEH